MRLTATQRKLVAENVGLVYAVIRRMGVAESTREDAESEGMVALCEAACTYRADRGAAFSTWATLRVGWHLRTWLGRRESLTAALPGPVAQQLQHWNGDDVEPAPGHALHASELVDMVMFELVTQLDSLDGQIVLLTAGGQTMSEIADRFGVSRNTVMRRLGRARGALSEVRAIMQSEVST